MRAPALSPQLLRFLARAAKVRRGMALGLSEDDPHVAALRDAVASHSSCELDDDVTLVALRAR